ncbi:hypothetical protein, partial [Klebsiella pneumoniae]|uniref:hypothetical protein n=1 Tax=Klebsiella pneumoniae TaxID=573 RepID=UPI0019538F63
FPVTPGFLRKLDPLFRNVQQFAPFYSWPKDRPPSEEEFYDVVSKLFRLGFGIAVLKEYSVKARPKLSHRGLFQRWYDGTIAFARSKKIE